MSFTEHYLRKLEAQQTQQGPQNPFDPNAPKTFEKVDYFGSAIQTLLADLSMSGHGQINDIDRIKDYLYTYSQKFSNYKQVATIFGALEHQIDILINYRERLITDLQKLGQGRSGSMSVFGQKQYNLNILINDLNKLFTIFKNIFDTTMGRWVQISNSNKLTAEEKQNLHYVISAFKRGYDLPTLRKLIDQINAFAAYNNPQTQPNTPQQVGQPKNTQQTNIQTPVSTQQTNIMDNNAVPAV